MRPCLVALLALFFTGRGFTAETAGPSQVTTAVEALTRLENVDLDARPAIKAAVDRLLERTRGTPQFLHLVQHFKLTNQTAGLLEVALNHPRDESGVAAMRLLLASDGQDPVRKALGTTNVADAVRLVEALGHAREKQVVPLLQEWVVDEARNIEVRRAAVTALTQTEEGATTLLTLAREQKLSDNLRFLAGSQLQSVRWAGLQREAAQILPLPSGQNAEPLPPLADLVRMKGEAARGAEIYRRDTTGCIKCHQVRGEGREVGPALTEIGSKLPKEALIEAILDPSAGISFGFEAWQLELKSGDDAYGLKSNETADEIAIKDVNGIITRYKRSEISTLQQSKVSIMPAGLQQTMTPQELVDLVEYLASLKKTGP